MNDGCYDGVPSYVTADDVGKPFLDLFGRTWDINRSLGRIRRSDVGRRVVLVDGSLRYES